MESLDYSPKAGVTGDFLLNASCKVRQGAPSEPSAFRWMLH